MRKSLMAALSLLMAAALTVTASAAGGSVSLMASADRVSPGDTFTVEAALSDAAQIKMGSVVLNYDTAALEMIGGTCHVSAMVAAVLPDQKAGTFLALSEKKVSGKLFTFEFKVLDTAPAGQYTILAEAAIGVSKGEPIEAGSVQVTVARPAQATQPQTPEETTIPQIHQETTEATESIPTQPAAPTKPESPAYTDTPKESKFRWTGPIAALILGVIGIGVKLSRKKENK